MSAVREGLPEGRYGRSADERTDRKLTIVGAALGAVLLGVIGWIGWDYVAGQSVSAEVIKFFDWAFKNGKQMALELDYVPLPDTLTNQIRQRVWSQINNK